MVATEGGIVLHETLTTDPEAWGLTPAQFASREKARLRDRERKRRQRALEASETSLAAMLPRNRVETFTTASGIRAVLEPFERQFMCSGNSKSVNTRVSLPFVSIQHRAALDKGREP